MQEFDTSTRDATDACLLIGQVSDRTGASCKAIRLYERVGLIPAPARRGRYRVYSEQDVFLVHMIKYGQQFGFSLAELHEIVDAKVRERVFPLERAKALCERKRQAIQREIAALLERDRALVAVQADMSRVFGDGV